MVRKRQSQARFIAYYRVSTNKQAVSGLGVKAQQEAVQRFLASQGDARAIASYQEAESGKRNDRPELDRAIAHCKRTGAALLIAKLDRLSRNAHFLLGILESGVEVRAADLPSATKLQFTIMASLAEWEGAIISKRTTDALQAAKRRGTKADGTPFSIGNPAGAALFDVKGRRERGIKRSLAVRNERRRRYIADMAMVISDIDPEGTETLETITNELNERGILPPSAHTMQATKLRKIALDLGEPVPDVGSWTIGSVHRLCKAIAAL